MEGEIDALGGGTELAILSGILLQLIHLGMYVSRKIDRCRCCGSDISCGAKEE